MNNNFIKHIKNNLTFYTSRNLDNFEFTKHFFSTKIGGVSSNEYESLNLGIYTNDTEKNVQENFKNIFQAASMQMNKITYLKQVHSDRFFVVNKDNYIDIRGQQGDALITKDKGIAIGVFTADCVPITVIDKKNKIIGVIHAGWKGTALEITKKVVNFMINNMESEIENIYAAIGPSIGPCCFEVGKEVGDRFTYVKEIESKLFVDLWKENIRQLKLIGVNDENITSSNMCTLCMEDTFYSYRRDFGKTGRLGTFIEIV